MDASSQYQDSLPISSDRLLEMLADAGFEYQRIDHIPLRTVQDSKQVRDGFLSAEDGGGHIKNLFLRDKRKQNFLVVLPEDKDVDLKSLAELLGAGRFSFGSADRLFEILGVRPGSGYTIINGQWQGASGQADYGCISAPVPLSLYAPSGQ